MQAWKATTLLLCFYGFMKELRPSEPFLTEYLIDKRWVNITLEQAYYDVYPVWTYSYLAVLVLVFIVTDYLRYKPVIVMEGVAYAATWSLLLWGRGVHAMQWMQFVYGVATSAEVAYYAYIYAKVDRSYYQLVTSLTRASLLWGRFISGVLAQLLISFQLMNYHQLNIFSLFSVSVAALVSLALPSARSSIYFHDGQSAWTRFRSNFSAAFRQRNVLRWSVWWALGTCGNFQVGNYIQPLWESIMPTHENNLVLYNGLVEAASTMTGAIMIVAFGYLNVDWSCIGEPVIGMISLLDGIILCVMASMQSIWVAYVGYWAFRGLYQMLITVASYQVASSIPDDSCGLVFGVNTFMALLFQSVLTLIVADDLGLALPPKKQFMVYGCFWLVIGAIFIGLYVARLCCSRRPPIQGQCINDKDDSCPEARAILIQRAGQPPLEGVIDPQ